MPQASLADHERTVPQLNPGLTLLRRPSHRSPALHQLILAELARTDGTAYWIDARNNASSYALYERLVKELPRRVSARTAFVVVPCTASLYGDDDLLDQKASDLLESALTILRELATIFEMLILVTTTGDTYSDLLADYATTEIEATSTALGLHYESDEFETQVYWHDGFWQITIPY